MARLPDISKLPQDTARDDAVRRDAAARSSSRDEIVAAMRPRVPELARELLGQPRMRSSREWRWGRQGSLALVIDGPKAGQWFDHEAGQGGGFIDLVARELGTDRRSAWDWVASRIGFAPPGYSPHHPPTPTRPAPSPDRPAAEIASPAPATPAAPPESRAERAQKAAEATWRIATPADGDHPYLRDKGIGAHGLRCDRAGRLLVPLRDLVDTLHTIEFIDEDGAKRYLAGGAKAGHFGLIGGPLDSAQEFLICEGWATAASAHEACALPVVAAMDAGNLGKVAARLRQRFTDADITIIADNDAKPDRQDNPGVAAATKAALAIGARLAIPPVPGDANDLAAAQGNEAVARLVSDAALIPDPEPTYPAPRLSVEEARAELQERITSFIGDVSHYWTEMAPADPLDFNTGAGITPPRLGLPVAVGLGKSRAARTAIAELIGSGALGTRKVIYAVPRHDLGAEQVEAFAALGVTAMLWKGRTAPDPSPDEPDQLMCRDPDATFDALEVEQPVERSCCKVKRSGILHTCSQFWTCGYQAQKPLARSAQVIVCAHDSLFHAKPDAITAVGLLVIDEGFWQAGLRGLDGKMLITEDSLEPDAATLTCFTSGGKVDYEATNDLLTLRGRLWKVLQSGLNGPLPHALLRSAGLTAKGCRIAAGLERARLRNPGLLPGMDAATRARKISKVLPPHGAPWAPPGRAAAMWKILADALDDAHDAAGVSIINAETENGSVRALKLRWRAPIRSGWVDDIPLLHLDATMRPELVAPYLPELAITEPVEAATPHVQARQVLGSPTSAKALTPGEAAPEREHKTSRRHLRDLITYVRARAKHVHQAGDKNFLVIGQKSAIDALRAETLPSCVDSVHFNALSGIDRWGEVAGLIIVGRTLPAPATVETLAIALSGRIPQREASSADWWYGSVERCIRLAGQRSHAVQSEAHDDPVVEAIRWSICEGELIQAIGRGRGVNRTADEPLQLDLLTDVVLPVTIDELIDWPELVPSRRDIMAARGVLLDNAADMARCFPDLWSSREAAKKDAKRRGTNGYYRTFYNSEMSPSSVAVVYRPEGAGQKLRRAVFDLTLIPKPQAWLIQHLGPLAVYEIDRSSRIAAAVAAQRDLEGTTSSDPLQSVQLTLLSERLEAAMAGDLARRHHRLAALTVRLRRFAPAPIHSRRMTGAIDPITATGGDQWLESPK